MEQANHLPPRPYSLPLLAGLFLAAWAFQVLVGNTVDPQSSIDAGYYHIIADRFVRGLGLTEPFIWNHLKSCTEIVRPIDYWMPLGILIYAAVRLVFGLAGEIGLNQVLWAALAVAVFRDTRRQGGKPLAAFAAFCLVGLGGKFAFYVATTDNIVFYAWLGFLLFKSLSWNGDPAAAGRQGLWCGFLAGCMTLTRIEGVLFAGLSGLVWLRRRQGKAFALLVLLFGLTIAPWVVRNVQVLGTPWPSNSQALFMRHYNDLFDPTREISRAAYLQNGWGWVIRQKLDALRGNLLEFYLIPSMVFLFPGWVAGVILHWSRGGRPLFLFTGFFWLVNGLLFTTQSLRGTAFHISAAFFPTGAVFSALGFQTFVEVLFRRFSQGFQRAMLLIVMLYMIVFSVVATQVTTANYDEDTDLYKSFFSREPSLPKGAMVVSSAPWYVSLFGGCGGVVCITKNATAAFDLAEKYSCPYILLDFRDAPGILTRPEGNGWIRQAIRLPLVLWEKTGGADGSAGSVGQ